MPTKIVKLKDNVLVEIEFDEEKSDQISTGPIGEIKATMEDLQPILLKICRPIISAWRELK